MADSEEECKAEGSENVETASNLAKSSSGNQVETKELDKVANSDFTKPQPSSTPPDEPDKQLREGLVEEALLERFLNSTPPPAACEDEEGGCEGTADLSDGGGETFLNFDKGEGEEELEGGGDEEESGEDIEEEGYVEGERQQGDGQESAEPTDSGDRILDFDEDKRNPQYIPKKGAFYEHDDRVLGGEETSVGADQSTSEEDKDGRRKKKLWHDEGVWGHDMFREEEQAPKSREELISTYGYDIRSEEMAPRARRRRRYSRGPNKYTRSWQDEDAYASRGFSSSRGGRRGRGRGRSPPSFEEKDFPQLPGSKAPEPPRETISEPVVKTQTFENSRYGGEERDDAKESVEESSIPQRLARNSDSWRPLRRPSAVQARENKVPRQPGRRPSHTSDLDDLIHNDVPKENSTFKTLDGGRRGRQHLEVSSRGGGRGRGQSWNRQGNRVNDVEALETGMERLNMKAVDTLRLGGADAESGEPNTNTTHTRGGAGGAGGDASSRPKRYSSLRQRPTTEVVAPLSFASRPAQFYDHSYQQQQQYLEATPSPASSSAPRQAPVTPTPPQPVLLPAGHFTAYASCHESFTQPPVIGATQPPVMAPMQTPVLTSTTAPVMAPDQSPVIPCSILPPPGIVSFPGQYPPYSFAPQYNASTPPAQPAQATTQPQKVCHGGITYYSAESQQHKLRSTPPRRPKAAIPIVPPPTSGVQEGEDKGSSVSLVEKMEDHYDQAPVERDSPVAAPPVES